MANSRLQNSRRPSEVGDRLARGPAIDERREPRGLGLVQGQIVFGEQGLRRKTQRMLHQQARLAPRRVDACGAQRGSRSAESLGPGRSRGAHSASARRAARSAVISGSMTSSRASPLNTLSSL